MGQVTYLNGKVDRNNYTRLQAKGIMVGNGWDYQDIELLTTYSHIVRLCNTDLFVIFACWNEGDTNCDICRVPYTNL